MRRLLYFLLLAGACACTTIEGFPNYSELDILFDADYLTMQAGETVEVPFTVTGSDGVTLSFTPSVNVTTFICKLAKVDYKTNQGVIKVTAPKTLSKDTEVQVTLKAFDSHSRKISRFMDILAKSNGGSEPEDPEPGEYGDLGIFFDAAEFAVNAGATVEIPFTVTGSEGATLKLETASDDPSYKCEFGKVDYLTYQGVINLTAPDIVTEAKTVKVSLSASDTHGRSLTKSVNVKVVPSADLSIVAIGDPKTMAVKAGGSFTLSYQVLNLAPAAISGTPVVEVTYGWTADVSVNSDIVKVKYTAPSEVTTVLDFTISVKDDHNRSAKLNGSLSVVPITEAAGASNCHITKPGSVLTIKAVKGNSAEALDFDNAVLVWQDEPSLITSVAGNGTDGVLVVKCNGSYEGNAVVAARKGNKVVWSWHVWVSDYDPEADIFEWKDANGNAYKYMDRNLGARSAEKNSWKSFGLMYQWGRKDPFPGGDDVESSIPVKIYDIKGNQVFINAVERPTYQDRTSTNLQLAIENPDVFYYAPSSSWPSVDWLTDQAALQNNDLWGGISGAKTIYDPCPEGWRVPAAGDGWGFRKEYKKGGKLNDGTPYDESYPWYQDHDKSVGFRYKTAAGKEYWFPLCGNIDCTKGTLQSVGGSALYNTRTDNSNTVLYENMAWGNPASETGLNRPYGAATRCVKE